MFALYEATHHPEPTAEPAESSARPAPGPSPTAPPPSRTTWASPGHRAAFVRGAMGKGSTPAGLAWLMGG